MTTQQVPDFVPYEHRQAYEILRYLVQASSQGTLVPSETGEAGEEARNFTQDLATAAAGNIVSIGIPLRGERLTYPTFAAGLEIWMSPAWTGNYSWRKLGQIQSLDGPEIEIDTLPAVGQPLTEAIGEGLDARVKATGTQFVQGLTNVHYRPWSGRLYYNPLLEVQTSEQGLLGSALYGSEMFVAIAYRKPEEFPYEYLPNFVLEWIGHAACTGYKQVLSNGVRYIDFQMSWLSVPFTYQQAMTGHTPSPLLNPSPDTLGFLPEIGVQRAPRNTYVEIQLPEVQGSGSWTYSLLGVPDGLIFSPGNRTLTGRAQAFGQYLAIYRATSGATILSAPFIISVGADQSQRGGD